MAEAPWLQSQDQRTGWEYRGQARSTEDRLGSTEDRLQSTEDRLGTQRTGWGAQRTGWGAQVSLTSWLVSRGNHPNFSPSSVSHIP